MNTNATLPIAALLPSILEKLAAPAARLVIEAPPGAGKSTLLPLALLKHLHASKKIILLQPRRLAVLSIAHYLAGQLGETVGQQVGYQIRGDSRTSATTRLVVMTEGLFVQQLQNDPELATVGLVIFDEFHERNAAGDLALAMLQDTLSLRTDLSVVVMSATIPAAAIATWLETDAMIRSEGRQFPITIEHRPVRPDQHYQQALIPVIHEAIERAQHGVLVFVPGSAEIDRVLAGLPVRDDVEYLPLHGQLQREEQERVLRPAAKKRVIIATNIAETSVTLPGIDVVVDSGRERSAHFYPQHGISRLLTKRISKASATQRAGRAGRLGPGVCFRLWAAQDEHGMRDYNPAEIEIADLTQFVLECKRWGSEPAQMRFLTSPNYTHIDVCESLLIDWGALTRHGTSTHVTASGKALGQLGTDIRYGLMIRAAAAGSTAMQSLAALVVAQLEQPARGHRQQFPLPPAKLQGLARQRWHHWQQHFKLSADAAQHAWQSANQAELLLYGFADRIAQRRGSSDRYVLVYGGGARMHEAADSARTDYLLALDLSFSEHSADAILRTVIPLVESDLEHPAVHIEERIYAGFFGPQQRLQQRRQWRLGAIVLKEQELPGSISSEQRIAALVVACQEQPARTLDDLPFHWTTASRQWLARLALLREVAPDLDLPHLQAAVLQRELTTWAAPYWSSLQTLNDLQRWDPLSALKQQLPYTHQQLLEQECPAVWQAPSGRTHAIDYTADQPTVAVKLQEVFGEPVSPRVARQQVTLTLDLLSPAGRLLQRTRDLASFWQNAYQEVKKEMKGRYPKHPWPDNPVQAVA
ncbi:MAG TPA: ATP-dependent helicase HrpB, partial [Pseudidiomarina sp.]|nr:ATP-dependent helicase HrpB [Pseudidiomarina sp.]